MGQRFEWNALKAESNLRKHGVSFAEATKLFTSGLPFVELYDASHSGDEDRFIAIGVVRRGLIVVAVVSREDDEIIRIISARPATRRERRLFFATMRGNR
jgi:uncharacterized protein